MLRDLQQLRIIRRPEVERITGLSRATLYRLIGDGSFPAPVKLTAGNAVGWRAGDIREWLESRERVDAPAPPAKDALDKRAGGAGGATPSPSDVGRRLGTPRRGGRR